MASRTENLGLIKPDLDDNIDVRQINNNSDVLDNKIYEVEQSVKKCVQKTGDTMTGTLFTSSDIRKSTNNSVLTFSGGNNSNTSATVDLCGGQRNNGVYAQLSVPTSDTDVKRSLQLNKDGNIYLNNVNSIEFTGDRIYSIGGDNKSITLDSIDNNIRIFTTSSNGVTIDTNGNVTQTGNNLNSSSNELRLFTTNFENSRVSIDNNKTIIYGTDECGIVFNTANFAFNPNGNLYINGDTVLKDNYTRDDSTEQILFRYWKLDPYTAILGIYVKNPNRLIDHIHVTFPFPFINTEYIVSTVGRTEETRVIEAEDYRATVGNCSTTGLDVSRDRYNGTDIFIIGRIK